MKTPSPAGTSTTLLERVRSLDDQCSWQTFHGIYARLVRGQAIRAGLSDDEAQEITQETLIELSRRLPSFEYDREKGSFTGWLYNLTRWRIKNHLKKKQHTMAALDAWSLSECAEEIQQLAAEPDETWMNEWRQAIFDAALDELRRTMRAKHFQVLDLLVIRGWSVASVGRTLNMSAARLYLVKARAVSALKQTIARLQNENF